MSNVIQLFSPAEKLVTDIFEAIDKNIDAGLSEFEIIGILDMVKHVFLNSIGEDDEDEE